MQYSRWLMISIGLLLSTTYVAAASLADLQLLRQQLKNTNQNTTKISALDQSREASKNQPVYVAPAKPKKPLPISAIEQDYSSRARTTLRQFGYDVYRNHTPNATINGSVAEDYLLGIGDEVIVTLQGQEKKTTTTKVDREGRVLLPGFPPIRASNRPFNEFRDELKSRIQDSMIGTEVYISVGAIRMISVVIAGEVNQPGRYQLTGLSSITDALYAADGVRKTGTLRRIRIQRAGRTISFDAYATLLGQGAIKSPALQHGDKIVVPTIGDTVAVAGSVKRPAIFELRYAKQLGNNLPTILDWAGGPIRNQGNRYLQQTLNSAGQTVYTNLNKRKTTTLHGGDILQVRVGSQRALGSITLSGNVQVPGTRSLKQYPTLAQLLGSPEKLKTIASAQTYLPFAVLWTTDPDTQARQFQAINLKKIVDGQYNHRFRDEDELIILNYTDIRFPMSADVQNILTGEYQRQEQLAQAAELSEGQQALKRENTVRQNKQCRSLTALRNTLAGETAQRFANAIRIVDNARWLSIQNCPASYEKHPELLGFMLEHMVIINGEVRHPGIYPVTEQTLLKELISFTGGITRTADQNNIELNRETYNKAQQGYQVRRQQLNFTQALATQLQPGDTLSFKPYISNRGQGGVLLVGQFNQPGLYTMTRGETLSEVIARAGGLTPEAYPYGAVLTRERLKRQERRNYARTARDLQDASFALLSNKRISNGGPAAVTAIEGLVRQLKETEPVGRIVMEADPTMLQLHPELDTLLEPGDTLYMPQRSNIVSVIGEVLNPGASSFIPGHHADDYIGLSGGLRRYADDDRVFVVLPNGAAQPLSINHWNYDATQIPPGSTIVVPRDPAPFDIYNFTHDITSIFSNLAVSAAAVATINDN